MSREEMTKEEAIDIIKSVRNNTLDYKLDKALDMAIKALEQEPILDKIRTDLYKLYNDRPSDYNHSQRTELFCKVIKILDKYRKGN